MILCQITSQSVNDMYAIEIDNFDFNPDKFRGRKCPSALQKNIKKREGSKDPRLIKKSYFYECEKTLENVFHNQFKIEDFETMFNSKAVAEKYFESQKGGINELTLNWYKNKYSEEQVDNEINANDISTAKNKIDDLYQQLVTEIIEKIFGESDKKHDYEKNTVMNMP